MSKLSVIIFPSSSIAGSKPLGTSWRNSLGLSPQLASSGLKVLLGVQIFEKLGVLLAALSSSCHKSALAPFLSRSQLASLQEEAKLSSEVGIWTHLAPCPIN